MAALASGAAGRGEDSARGRRGRPARALRLASAATALRQANGKPTSPGDQAQLDHSLKMARQMLGEEEAAAAWTSGQAMTLEQSVAYALADDAD